MYVCRYVGTYVRTYVRTYVCTHFLMMNAVCGFPLCEVSVKRDSRGPTGFPAFRSATPVGEVMNSVIVVLNVSP